MCVKMFNITRILLYLYREKEKENKVLRSSAPFWPFLYKIGQNSAADLSDLSNFNKVSVKRFFT
jgi:hypothetical protein